MGVKDPQDEGQPEKDCRQPGGDFDQNVGRLRSENIFGHASAESGPEAFAFRALHQDYEHHQEGVDDVNPEQNVDQNRHWDGQYDKQMTNVE